MRNREEHIREEHIIKACEGIRQALALKNSNLAISIIKSASNYLEAESFIRVVLEEEWPSGKVLNEGLNVFMNLHPNDPSEHDYWVHSLGHFIGSLWNLRKTKWIGVLYELAFKEAFNCHIKHESLYNYLVYEFDQYSKWFDNPSDFHVTFDNLSWYKWSGRDKHIKERIKHGPFESEKAFICWKFLNPTFYLTWDMGGQKYLFSVRKMRADILRISKIGSKS